MELKTEQCLVPQRNGITRKMPFLFYISISIHYFNAGLLPHLGPEYFVSSATPWFFPDNRDLAQLSGQMSNSDTSLLTLPQAGSVVTADILQGEFSN